MGARASDVADVVQETFLAAARSARQFDSSRGTLWSWLAGIAHHQTAAFWRRTDRAGKIRALADAAALEARQWLAASTSPYNACEQRELAELVRHVLAELPAEYAALLT